MLFGLVPPTPEEEHRAFVWALAVAVALPLGAGVVGARRYGWRPTLPALLVGWGSGIITFALAVLWDVHQRVSHGRAAAGPGGDWGELVVRDLRLIWVPAVLGVCGGLAVAGRTPRRRGWAFLGLGLGVPAVLAGGFWGLRLAM